MIFLGGVNHIGTIMPYSLMGQIVNSLNENAFHNVERGFHDLFSNPRREPRKHPPLGLDCLRESDPAGIEVLYGGNSVRRLVCLLKQASVVCIHLFRHMGIHRALL